MSNYYVVHLKSYMSIISPKKKVYFKKDLLFYLLPNINTIQCYQGMSGKSPAIVSIMRITCVTWI